MLRWLLPFTALILAALSSLTMLKAPTLLLWKVAILVGEFGHWLFLGVLLLLVFTLTRKSTSHAPRLITAFGCIAASGLLLVPHFQSWHLREEIRQSLAGAFGSAEVPRAPYSIAGLFSTTPRAEIETHTFAQCENASALQLDFFRPAITAGKAAPCVVVIHSGGWSAGERSEFPDLNHHLATRGIAVAAIDYRLAPQHIWPAARDDVRAALVYLKKNATRLGIAPDAFVVLGRSAGGQIAQAVAYDRSDFAIRGVISLYAPADLLFAWKHTSERDLLDSRKLMLDYLGGTPETHPSAFAAASPLLYVTKDSPPTLILHGQRDALVWFRQSERLAEKLCALGVSHSFIALPWATHAFDYNPHGPGGQLTAYTVEHFVRAVSTPTASPKRSYVQ